MRYLTFMRSSESYRKSGPPEALMEAMGTFMGKCAQEGILVSAGGLTPSRDGLLMRVKNGEILVTDGPFAETKEVIGGWAILEAPTKDVILRSCREFMQLHIDHWPGFEGESEIRLIDE